MTGAFTYPCQPLGRGAASAAGWVRARWLARGDPPRPSATPPRRGEKCKVGQTFLSAPPYPVQGKTRDNDETENTTLGMASRAGPAQRGSPLAFSPAHAQPPALFSAVEATTAQATTPATEANPPGPDRAPATPRSVGLDLAHPGPRHRG